MYFLCELITTKGACPSCNPFNTAGIFLIARVAFPNSSMVDGRGARSLQNRTTG